MYKFYLPIGDYFEQGHCVYQQFLAEAEKPIEDVRLAHTFIKDVTGIDITGFADKEENNIIPPDVVGKLVSLGYKSKTPLFRDKQGIHLADADTCYNNPHVLADIWLFLLNVVDPSLHCRLVDLSEEIPTLLTDEANEDDSLGRNVGYGITFTF